MNYPQQTYPGIVSVEIIAAAYIPADVPLMGRAGMKVRVTGPATPVSLCALGELTVEIKGENGGETATARLKFRSTDVIRPSAGCGFMLTDAGGRRWLLGSREAPWPRITLTGTSGTLDGAAAIDYSIELTSISPIAEIE